MKTGHLIDIIRRHGFEATLDGDNLLLKPDVPDAALPDAVLALVREHKPALVALLRSLPAFSDEEERKLVDRYCAAPRAERLAMHRAGKAKHANGWPWRESDLQAMRDHFEGKP